MSPGRSFGTKEYGCPHLVQNPSVRPGRSPRERPTGAPQSPLLQNRLRSGTSGRSSTADRGSGRGTAGMVTRPAPSLLRPDAEAADSELRTETERAVAAPGRERESRPETERREVEEREDREDREEGAEGAEEDEEPESEPEPEPRPDPLQPLPDPPDLGAPPDPPDPPVLPPPATPVAGEPTMPSGETTGASPQVSQYSSPPPTSSYEPSQPGR